MNSRDAVLEATDIVHRAERNMREAGLASEAVRIVFSEDSLLPISVFRPPCHMVINLAKARNMTRAKLTDAILDNIAMCAYYRAYNRDLVRYHQTMSNLDQPPRRPTFGEGRWREMRDICSKGFDSAFAELDNPL